MTVQVHTIRTSMSVAYLVTTERGMILVDAGLGAEGPLMRRMRRLGRDDLKAIFITHAHLDHYGCAGALRRLTGAALGVHRADSAAMARGDSPVVSGRGLGRLVVPFLSVVGDRFGAEPTPADLTLADGDSLDGLGVSTFLLHTPGHTDGSSCLIVDDRLAFVGDLLSGPIRPRVQHTFAVDWSQLPRSLQRLQALRPERVYTGHGMRGPCAAARSWPLRPARPTEPR